MNHTKNYANAEHSTIRTHHRIKKWFGAMPARRILQVKGTVILIEGFCILDHKLTHVLFLYSIYMSLCSCLIFLHQLQLLGKGSIRSGRIDLSWIERCTKIGFIIIEYIQCTILFVPCLAVDLFNTLSSFLKPGQGATLMG